MDIEMNGRSLDDIIKRDKKLGRVRQNDGGRGRPLPGRGRGGRFNTLGNRQQPRIRPNQNGIQKQAGNLQNNNQQLTRSQIRNRKRKERLLGNTNAGETARPNTNVQGAGNRRQLLQNLRQNRRTRGRRVNIGNGQVQPRNPQGQLRKRQPQAPVVANQQRQQNVNQPQQNNALNVVQGTLAQRKIKVRGIDARVVTVQDLQKLFGKCGPLINASFDTNEFGAYLGTATVIYSKASSAARAIKDYHLAQIDNRPMKISYAIVQNATPTNNQQTNAPAQQQQRTNGVRRTNNRIGKSGRGRTLNVMANGGRNQ